MELQPVDFLANTCRHFNESTRSLLHRRLVIALTSMLVVLLTLKILGLVFAGTTFSDFLLRMSTAVVLAGVVAKLFLTPQATLRQLRVLETVGGIVLVVDLVWVLVAETHGKLAVKETEWLPTLCVTLPPK